MSEAKGLIFDDKLRYLAPALFLLWIKFNFENEPINCMHLVDVRKLDISEKAWPGLKK